MSGMVEDELARAEAHSADARKRLTGTMIALQSRLKPSALARDAVDELKETAGEIAKVALDSARRRPAAVIGTVAAATLLLARKPIARLLRRKPDRP